MAYRSAQVFVSTKTVRRLRLVQKLFPATNPQASTYEPERLSNQASSTSQIRIVGITPFGGAPPLASSAAVEHVRASAVASAFGAEETWLTCGVNAEGPESPRCDCAPASF